MRLTSRVPPNTLSERSVTVRPVLVVDSFKLLQVTRTFWWCPSVNSFKFL
jgi:hypothetical protein